MLRIITDKPFTEYSVGQSLMVSIEHFEMPIMISIIDIIDSDIMIVDRLTSPNSFLEACGRVSKERYQEDTHKIELGRTPGEVADSGHTEQMDAVLANHKSELHPITLSSLYTAEEIQTRVGILAQQIKKDYDNRKITVLCVLKGAVIFCSDLIRNLSDVELDFIQCRSYEGIRSNELPKIYLNPSIILKDKYVLIVEDITDTGLSLDIIQNYVLGKNPAEIRTCVLLSKNKTQIVPQYTGFAIPNKFVVGYGMDYNEMFRNLTGIYYLNETAYYRR